MLYNSIVYDTTKSIIVYADNTAAAINMAPTTNNTVRKPYFWHSGKRKYNRLHNFIYFYIWS